MSIWTLGNAMELAAVELPFKVLLSNLQYVGITIIPASWLAFVLEYTSNKYWLTRRRTLLLTIEPIIVVLLAMTSTHHQFLEYGFGIETRGDFVLLTVKFGPLFWAHTAYSYLLLMTATIVLFRAFFVHRALYRGQIFTLLLGAVTPWLANALTIFELFPLPNLDLTPISLSVTGLTWGYSLHRFRLFDIVPVARDRLVENMRDGVMVLDVRNRVVDMNPSALGITNCTRAEAIGQPVDRVLSNRNDLLERFRGVVTAETEITFETDGIRRDYALRITPLYDEYGDVKARMFVAHDITQQKATQEELRAYHDHLQDLVDSRTAELKAANLRLENEISRRGQVAAELRQSLREKEVLLREIHHRVKNNMQVISSVLNLQADKTMDEAAKDIFREGQNRIRSMALIHEQLYRSNSLTSINFTEYTYDLTRHLIGLYEASVKGIQLQIKAEDIQMDIDSAITCGLILNELVSNALKHAFPNGEGGSITIEVQAREDNQYMLMVCDDGIGLPADLDLNYTTTLGLRLVNSLVQQLAGTSQFHRDSGTVFTLSFTPPALETHSTDETDQDNL